MSGDASGLGRGRNAGSVDQHVDRFQLQKYPMFLPSACSFAVKGWSLILQSLRQGWPVPCVGLWSEVEGACALSRGLKAFVSSLSQAAVAV